MVGEIYPYPNGTIWGFDGLVNYVVSVEPAFFTVLLFVLWFIAIIVVKVASGSTSRAWTFASFMATILSFPLAMMGWLNPNWIYFFAILLLVGVAWIRIGDSYY
jgi:hypothetical protein